MKRTLFIIILLLLLVACSTNTYDVVEIEAINLRDGNNIIISKDSKDAGVILNAIKKKEKTDKDVTSLLTYEILLKNDRTEAFKLYFDLENFAIYLKQKDKLYKVKEPAAKELFLSEAFSYIYVDSTIYDYYIELNGKKISPVIEYNWTSKNIKGHFINNKGVLTGKHKKTSEISVSQTDDIDIKFEKQPNNISIRVYDGENLISSGSNLKDVLNNIQNDGEYIVECQSQWHLKENSKFYGSQTLKFKSLVDRPAEINIITRENYPGNILLITVENLNEDETITVSTDAVKTDNDIFDYKDKSYFMLPIDLYAQPGEHKITAIVNKGTKNEYTLEKTFTVPDKAFKTQYLTVSEEMNETNNDSAAVYEYAQLVKPARVDSVKEKLWEGTFIMPVEGELTTDFAEIRYINKEPSSSRHSGLDLAASAGTPVRAPNNGIVAFSMEGLLSPGNTIVIDHGMGIFTSYYHLDTIEVKKGSEVKKGDIIATVGSTGFSTGPHLHYAVSIYNTYVNPYQTLSGIID